MQTMKITRWGRNAAAPPYETFLRNNTVALWAEGMRADATPDQVSHMVFCLMEIALT